MAFPTAPANGDRHIADDDTYIFNNGAWVKQKPSVPVGTIINSVLDETRFNTVAPSGDWALCDGRDITGTRLATITGWTAVPDLRAAYLRMGGNNAGNTAWQASAPGSFEEDTTKRPKNTAFTTNATGNHYHSIGAYEQETQDMVQQYHSYTAGNPSPQATHMFKVEDPHKGGNQAEGNEKEMATSGDGNHSHTIEGGDRETRPKSYTVYYYIKTN